MAADEHVPIRAESDILAARRVARTLATGLGFSDIEQIEIATAISEIARNTLTYAREGEMRFAVVQRRAQTGLQVTAEDRGPGIPDLARAMGDGFSTGGGLGLGLPGAKRLMDGFEIASTPGAGTRIVMTKWSRR
jgi:serine/threonine-protein kinase RsbT